MVLLFRTFLIILLKKCISYLITNVVNELKLIINNIKKINAIY